MNKFLKAGLFVLGGAVAAKGLDNRLEITHYSIKSPKIPDSFNGFKIVQISDVHSDDIPGLVSEIQSEAPDIIVSTGDIVHHTGDYSSAARLCEKLMRIAPVYTVTGNHDVWRGDYNDMEDELDALGVKTLHNELIELNRGPRHIALYGIDDPFSVTKTGINAFLTEALEKMPDYDGFSILLFHRANWLDYFADYKFDLIISGHMHGGQVRMPVFGGLVSPRSNWTNTRSMLFPKYTGGIFEKKGVKMIVSRGLGNPMRVPRLFNRPELVVITLKSN